jgi:hypothetical protein
MLSGSRPSLRDRATLGRLRQPFRQPVARPVQLGPEYNPWFWNPRRPHTVRPSASFMERLHEIDAKLEVTWNPITTRWQVWTPMPRMNHPICQGWRMLFVHQDSDGRFLPLDERLFARLYWSSADAWGSAKGYFDQVQRVEEEARARREAASVDQSYKLSQEYLEYTKVKNIGAGNKFSRYL